MTTESTAINYKIGNERLISVTENAARKLASLLEEKGKPEGALRLAVIGGGGFRLQYFMGFGGGPKEGRNYMPTLNYPLVNEIQNEHFFSRVWVAFLEELAK